MKKVIRSDSVPLILVFLFSGLSSSGMAVQTRPEGVITYQTFYDNLSPYGTWVDYPGYGHVWSPRVDEDFRPYATNGNWAYSDEGWLWESNYNWGWAPFHYGSWLYDDTYGWLWIPGYDWSPAWVTWGYVDDYYCWAPIMPGVNIDLQFGSWRPHSFYWNVCGRSHIYDKDLSGVIERRDRVNGIAGRISIINNFNTTKINNFYAKGPDVHDVERYTNRKIQPVTFKEVNRISESRQDGNVMKVYRPSIQNPRPHDFRRAEISQINPIQHDDQQPSGERMQQRNNIESLPSHRDGGHTFRGGGGGGRRR